jgi:hypothetical protein
VLIADCDPDYRSIRRTPLVVLAGLVLLAGAGCCCPPAKSCGQTAKNGWDNPCRTQLLFYAPPGAMVEVRAAGPGSSRMIQSPGAFSDRLERSPEEACIYNLSPGRYEFKYTTAEGVPGASIYGELVVYHANSHTAATFQRLAFVPISVPSEYYTKVEARGDELFPYRGEGYRTAIDEQDLERVKAGDVVEKVFVVADTEDADKRLRKTEVNIAAAEREIEYSEARFREAYYSFRTDVTDSWANFWGTDRNFIHWEKKRQKAQQDLDKLVALRQRTKSLIKADHVLIREGMLVLATQELVRPYEDVVKSAEDIGEVLLVMRIGGRHMKWGEPAGELAAYKP